MKSLYIFISFNLKKLLDNGAYAFTCDMKSSLTRASINDNRD